MNLNELGVQELNAQEKQKTDGGFWWFRLTLGFTEFTHDFVQAPLEYS